jgi:mannitol/fructose-specific phosphotransferase system IIA component (Ntr-type)
MNLDSLLSSQRIIPDLQATEHWPAIVELIDYLDQNEQMVGADKDAILEALKEREEKISTGIGYGVAIPHAFCDSIKEVVTGFARSKEGVEFGAIDNIPVNFIILFLVPKDQYQLHLKTLAAIAKMFNNAAIRQELTDAQSAEDILNTFANRPSRV